jgi:peptidoglycan/LPS O-acetylase OafA/YrhL
MTSMKQETRIPSLDGLRAIAVLFVVFSHMLGTGGFLQPAKTNPLYELGNLGVKIFFVISGYLITNLLLQELERNNKIHLGKFYFRRTFRIFPACYAMIAGLIVLRGAGWIDLTPRDVFHALSYTSNYFPQRSWNVGHTWSLGVEEQFYLLWPATLVLLGRRRGFLAAGAVVLACPLIRIVLWNGFHVSGVGHRFETIADAIATGCLFAGARGRWFLSE